jgi:hypothetical protein
MGNDMIPASRAITGHPAWRALEDHHRAVRDRHLRQLFADDPRRGERMSAEAAGIYLDYSKNRVTEETVKLLFDLAEAVDLRGRIEGMFRGDKINVSERRAVLHVALRAPKGASILVDGENVVPAVHASSTGWPTSRTASAAAPGRGTPAGVSATSSISASAVPTSGRRWRTRR